MCHITILRRPTPGQSLEDTDSLLTAFCVFGEYCAVIGHSRTLYQHGVFGACPACDDGLIDISEWSHEASGGAPTTVAAPKPLNRKLVDADAVNRTAEAELLKIMHSGSLQQYHEFASLLHYILSLPEDKVNKGRLLEIYGANLGDKIDVTDRKKLRKTAAIHDPNRRLVFFKNGVMLSDASSSDDGDNESYYNVTPSKLYSK
jgi:hypothetical protein